jgi:DNA-directed RNA polymerase specialized sigma54-like protein
LVKDLAGSGITVARRALINDRKVMEIPGSRSRLNWTKQ